MSLMRPDLSRALSFRFVGTLRLSTQRSRKNFLLILLVLELDAIALLYANAECQQKAIVPFFNVDASGERCWKKCDTSYWQYYTPDRRQKYHFSRQEYAKSHQYLA